MKAIHAHEVNSIANGVVPVPKLAVVITVIDTKVIVKFDTATAANFFFLKGMKKFRKFVGLQHFTQISMCE